MVEKHGEVFGKCSIEQKLLRAFQDDLIGPDKEYEDLEDWCWSNDYCAFEAGGSEPGAGALVANVTTRIFGIPISYVGGCDDCGSEPTIMYIPTYPWNLNEKEKALTLDRLESILYWILLECFGISREQEKVLEMIEEQDLEYYG